MNPATMKISVKGMRGSPLRFLFSAGLQRPYLPHLTSPDRAGPQAVWADCTQLKFRAAPRIFVPTLPAYWGNGATLDAFFMGPRDPSRLAEAPANMAA
jgi:hypothetical protein